MSDEVTRLLDELTELKQWKLERLYDDLRQDEKEILRRTEEVEQLFERWGNLISPEKRISAEREYNGADNLVNLLRDGNADTLREIRTLEKSLGLSYPQPLLSPYVSMAERGLNSDSLLADDVKPLFEN